MDVPSKQPAPHPVLPYASPATPQGIAPAHLSAHLSAPALTPEQLTQLATARKLGSGLRRAAIVGKIDAWTIGIFGVITLVGSIGSIHGMLLGVGMAVLAFFQLKAADRLKQLDDNAPALLARNQIILGILLFAYGGISLMLLRNNPAPLTAAVGAGAEDPEVAEMLAPYNDLVRSLLTTIYVGVMATAVIGCGLTAAYYYAQRKRIIAYRTSTPEWILALQQAGMMI